MDILNLNKLPKSFKQEDFVSKIIKNKKIDIEFIYASDFKNTKFLRDFVEVLCCTLGFPHKDISRLILIVDELNNNAIEYGSEKNGKNKFRISTINKGNHINIKLEVEDTGKGEKHKTALEMETLRAHQLKLGYGHHNSIRGRGLFMIVVKSVDRLYFRDTENGGLIVGVKNKILI